MRLDGSLEADAFGSGARGDPPVTETELDVLFTSAYQELRRLAGSIRRKDSNATLNPTALVNEAWLKMAASPGLSIGSRLHFKRIAARAMRQVLVDAARRRKTTKRGGENMALVTFDEDSESTATAGDLLNLDEALQELARIEPRHATVVECRFFGGLEVAETAAALGISEATVLRDWRAARAWLARELRRTS